VLTEAKLVTFQCDLVFKSPCHIETISMQAIISLRHFLNDLIIVAAHTHQFTPSAHLLRRRHRIEHTPRLEHCRVAFEVLFKMLGDVPRFQLLELLELQLDSTHLPRVRFSKVRSYSRDFH
jgi:hypothetical protein